MSAQMAWLRMVGLTEGRSRTSLHPITLATQDRTLCDHHGLQSGGGSFTLIPLHINCRKYYNEGFVGANERVNCYAVNLLQSQKNNIPAVASNANLLVNVNNPPF